MRILGIDPGCNGGVAVVELLDSSVPTLLGAGVIPTIGTNAKQRVDVRQLHDWVLRHLPLQHALIEHAQEMPRQGASSGFKYGRAVGTIEAVIAILQIPISIIEPRRWKKSTGCTAKTRKAVVSARFSCFQSRTNCSP
jgi:crossover junction endodeoxyribonuclease RuvC